jgi:hypothetical protein
MPEQVINQPDEFLDNVGGDVKEKGEHQVPEHVA